MSAGRKLGLASALLVASCYGDGGTSVGSPYPIADVRLVTDDMGITHVYAMSDADALYGTGYAMAKDRPLQLELTRRRALGTTAELLGQRAFLGDLGARAFDFRKLGSQDEARARAERPEDAKLVVAFVAGVNARLDEVRSGVTPRPYGMGSAELDFYPEPWTGAEVYAVGKLLAFGLSNTLEAEVLATALLRLAPETMKRLPISLPAYDVFTLGEPPVNGQAPAPPRLPDSDQRPQVVDIDHIGIRSLFEGGHSNNWAVDAKHSSNGRPLIAGDPHQPLTSPSRFWPVHVSSVQGDGTLDVVGFVFVGTPIVELGHNAHVAWTATTSFVDVMDLWDVTTDADRSVVQLANGAWPIEQRKETIRVKNGAGLEVIDVVLEDVPGYGILLPAPVLPLPRSFLADGNAILFNWTGFRATRELSGYLAIDRARSVDDFDQAADLIDVGAVNFVAADNEHIDYRVHARVPDRGDPSSHAMPWRILKGTDAASLWTERELGPEKLPHQRDPARGFFVTANNDPWGFTADGNVENDPFYFGAFYSTGARAHRIEQRLSELTDGGAKLGRDDMEVLQRDLHSSFADSLLPKLAQAIEASTKEPALAIYAAREDLRALGATLAAWDRRMNRERGEPIAFVALEWFAAKRAFSKAVPSALFDAIAQKSPPFFLGLLRSVLDGRFAAAASFLPAEDAGGASALLLGALDDTTAWLKSRFGTLDLATLRYGDVNVAIFANDYGGALNPPAVGVDGAVDTVKVSEAQFFGPSGPLDRFPSKEISLYRMAAGFGADGVPEATLNFARGAREDPQDERFGDQEARWIAGEHRPLAFREAEVESRKTAEITLRAR